MKEYLETVYLPPSRIPLEANRGWRGRAPGATYAFDRGPLSRASRPFHRSDPEGKQRVEGGDRWGRARNVSEGRIPALRGSRCNGKNAQKAAVPWSAPQNGNAYEEVLSDAWSPIRAYWQDTSPATGRASRIPRCNSTCPTIRATSRSIRPSRSISGPIRRPCWRHWGQKRPILPAGEGRGVQARHRERDCALLRYQTFRAGDACPRGRGGHSRLPSLNDNVNRNSPDAS
jgi:hypothetical protein